MARNWIKQHPRLLFLTIGLLIGTGLAWFASDQSDKTVREYKEINRRILEEYSKKTETLTATVTKLRQENHKLKKKSSTFKIVRPDGTIEERTTSESESESQISESVKEQYQKMVIEETGKIHKFYSEKIEKLTKERRRLNLSSAVSTSLDWYVNGSYSIWGPVTIGGGLINPHQNPSYMFSLGVNL